jgi:CheY-like chemotaxis protein
MHGQIGLSSTIGRGSTFWFTAILRLPPPAPDPTVQPALAERPNATDAPRSRILLVEDNAIGRKVAQRLLEKAGYHTTAAVDGRSALAALSKDHYDLVLMDIHMPDMDGVAVTQAIRAGAAGEDNRAIHIIALTADTQLTDRERFTGAGMNDYIPKPVERAALLSALMRAGARPLTSGTPASAAGAQAGQPVFAPLAAIGRMSGELQTFRESLALFLEQIPARLEKLRTGIAQGDLRQIGEQAHSVHGAAATIGAEALGAASRRLQEAARAAQPEQCRQLLATLEQEFSRLREAIQHSEFRGQASPPRPADQP